MAARTGEVRAGFIVSLEQEEKKEGQPTVFKATQIPSVNSLPIAHPVNCQAIREIVWSIGPVKE
ncbi:hypothetical protein EYZ11_012920 [Aspergillus tanneri]|uniref:Uncharacterized protein n=1 Tax=Aspergillus tanneri TaxID=1220188 RepID=A0A4S3J4E1_9EURO|nr:hypothetical protein EYZ11_012920 [Aspergillus tanneri]